MFGQTQTKPLSASIGTNSLQFKTLKKQTIYFSYNSPEAGICTIDACGYSTLNGYSTPTCSINFEVKKGDNPFYLNSEISYIDTIFNLTFRNFQKGETDQNPLSISQKNEFTPQIAYTIYSVNVPANSMIYIKNRKNIKGCYCYNYVNQKDYTNCNDSVFFIKTEGKYFISVSSLSSGTISFDYEIKPYTPIGESITNAIEMKLGKNEVDPMPLGYCWFKYKSDKISALRVSNNDKNSHVNLSFYDEDDYHQYFNRSLYIKTIIDSIGTTFYYTQENEYLYLKIIINGYTNSNFILTSSALTEGQTCANAKAATTGKNKISFDGEWFEYTASHDGSVAFKRTNDTLYSYYNTYFQLDYFDCTMKENTYNPSFKEKFPCKKGQKFYIYARFKDSTFYVTEHTISESGLITNPVQILEATNNALFHDGNKYSYIFKPQKDQLVTLNGIYDSLFFECSSNNQTIEMNNKYSSDFSSSSFIAKKGQSYIITAVSYYYYEKNWLFHSTDLTSSIEAENLYKNLNYAYLTLNFKDISIGHGGLMIGDVCSRQSEAGGAIYLESLMLFKPGLYENTLTDLWRNTYIGIDFANLTIKQCNESSLLTDSLKKQYLGEAYFLRALNYFYLLNFWGEIPIQPEPFLGNKSVVPSLDNYGSNYSNELLLMKFGAKASKAKVWNQIEQDLIQASKLLPGKSLYSTNEKWRASKGSANALLCKAYLFQEKWQLAKQTADTVIKSGEYALSPNYHDIFTQKGEFDSEKIFEINCIADNHPWKYFTDYSTYRTAERTMRIANGYNGMLGSQYDSPTKLLVNKYDVMNTDGSLEHWQNGKTYKDWDPRLDLIAKKGDSISINSKWYKYAVNGVYQFATRKSEESNSAPTQSSGLNIPMIRYADLLLWHAEAEMHLGNETSALNTVNAIRTRARNSKRIANGTGGYQQTTGTIPENYTSIDLNKIYKERDLELSMEGHGFFDLVRTGRANSILGIDTVDLKNRKIEFKKDTNEVFPIPVASISINNDSITQNKGYYIPKKSINLINQLHDTTVFRGLQVIVFDIKNIFSKNGQAYIPSKLGEISFYIGYLSYYSNYYNGKLYVQLSNYTNGTIKIPYLLHDSCYAVGDSVAINIIDKTGPLTTKISDDGKSIEIIFNSDIQLNKDISSMFTINSIDSSYKAIKTTIKPGYNNTIIISLENPINKTTPITLHYNGSDIVDKNGIVVSSFITNTYLNSIESKNLIEKVIETKTDEITIQPSVYPIPCKDYLNIICFNKGINKVEVYDISGKLVYKTEVAENCSLNTNNLSSGIYFIKIIESQNKIFNYKFTKQQ